MKVREAEPKDAEAIARVHLESWKTTYPGIIPQAHIDGLRLENGIANWKQRLAGRLVILVAEGEAGVVGFAAGGAIVHRVDGFDGELGAIYLLTSHQGQGLGKALVKGIAERLRLEGFANMVVWVLKENPACGFYERMGGVRVAEQMIEIGGAALPEVAFGWKNIESLFDSRT